MELSGIIFQQHLPQSRGFSVDCRHSQKGMLGRSVQSRFLFPAELRDPLALVLHPLPEDIVVNVASRRSEPHPFFLALGNFLCRLSRINKYLNM
jgi:hypothetical protein